MGSVVLASFENPLLENVDFYCTIIFLVLILLVKVILKRICKTAKETGNLKIIRRNDNPHTVVFGKLICSHAFRPVLLFFRSSKGINVKRN